MLQLKQYQILALDALKDYFELCHRIGNVDTAFYEATRQRLGQGISYHSITELPGLPYICLRMPTGGGKTLVAAHSIGVCAETFLRKEHTLVLWLVPSNAIREQTIQALKNRSHPYRQAVEKNAAAVSVLDVSEALAVQPNTLSNSTTIIVSTLQAFRVEETEGRKVYEPSGSLMNHFNDIPERLYGALDCYENGKPKPTLANVLCLHRPLVIMDEAHNARTPLSFETLERFQPSCIIELTATPDTEKNPSNVLHSVSAAELKAEEMIKLPIRLEAHPDWKVVVHQAVALRGKLEEKARQEQRQTGEYIRPIILFQAQPSFQDRPSVTVDVLEACLKEDEMIPAEQIARATGSDRELEGVDLSKPDCPIRYILTIQALREGWDCPFAYVLCTVSELRSNTAVEQILGRVLRLPKAKAKLQPALNMAYAFASSDNFVNTANELGEALVQSGFERQEVRDLIQTEQLDFGYSDLPLFTSQPEDREFEVRVTETPALGKLPEELSERVRYHADTQKLVLRGALSQEEVAQIQRCFESKENQKVFKMEYEKSVLARPKPSRSIIEVPLLAVRQRGLLEKFEETHIREQPWRLTDFRASLSEGEFSSAPQHSKQVLIDISERGKLKTSFLETLQYQTDLLRKDSGWKEQTLVNWLDRNIPHPDIPMHDSVAFLSGLIADLLTNRNLALEYLVAHKYRLRDAVEAKISAYRRKAQADAFQQYLLPDSPAPLVVTPEICFQYAPEPMNYPCSPNSLYEGRHQFKKHYYPVVGDLRNSGEEFECAQMIDSLPEVAVWVRNLERRPQHAFWLQTSTDKFYPDFVCKLKDGRYLVVEYKGEDRWSNDDSREKRMIGEVWAERSEGKCLFVMPKGKDWDAVRGKIDGSTATE